MVNLDEQLWELGTQRLHQGLSETILVNTLTDVREFKKKKKQKCTYRFTGICLFQNSLIIHGIIHQIVFEYFDLYFLLFITIKSDMKTAQKIV